MKKRIALVLAMAMAVSAFSTTNLSSSTILAEAAEEVSSIKASEVLDMSGLVGWATVPGEGVDTVVGGGDVRPVVVYDYEDLQRLASDNVPRVIFISGTIKTVGKTVTVGSNKTIMGIDENATLEGGFEIKNACNVIISNLNIKGLWPSTKPDDGILVNASHHLWFDHLNIWDAPDGNLDLGNGTDYVTISWCKFWYTDWNHDHRFSNLVGSGTGHDDTDMGKLNVTYHHNWFADKVDQRMPRILYGKGHVYNNYYTAAENYYCIGVGCFASALIENNYFKDVHNPHWFMYPNDLPAYITERNNLYENTTGDKQSGYADGGGYPDGYVEPFDNPPYTYYPDAAEDVPAIVQEYVGPHNILEGEASSPTRAPEVTPYPEPVVTKAPLETSTPAPEVTDNPITYDAESKTYNYHGVNSDNSNASYDIPNPFKGLDLSETPEYDENGHPVWKNGVTISYWIKLPEASTDVPVLNFNLADDREMSMYDKFLYDKCQEAKDGTGGYTIGTPETYYSMTGKEITVLKSPGRYSKYNPNFPTEGAYRIVADGDIAAYKEGADLTDSASYELLTYYGEGLYKNYGARFDEEGGEESLISEACIDSSLSLFATGSVVFGRDDLTSDQLNPNVDSYGIESYINIDGENGLIYYGNAGRHAVSGHPIVPTVAEKDQWHFVVTVIQNDWIQTYMDGIKLDEEYLNEGYGWEMDEGVAGGGFNLGHGAKGYYLENKLSDRSYGKTILDVLTDERTSLTIGGMGDVAAIFGMGTVKTTDGVQVKDIRFYTVPLADENVGEERTQTFTKGWKLEGDTLVEIEADAEPVPTIAPTATPEPTATPDPTSTPTAEPLYQMGDVDLNDKVDASDALAVLKHAAKLDQLGEVAKDLADVEKDGNIDAADALKILKYAARLIDEM